MTPGNEPPADSHFPFEPGTWLVERNNPGRAGKFTGRTQRMGRILMLQLEYGPQDTAYRPEGQLEPALVRRSMRQMLAEGRFGQVMDLRRLITFEKLKGTLDEVIYSMEAAQIDFLPYQFKPVLKFTQSRTQRLLLADEVGLGKTIESGLIWLEMQARSDARRLLVVCKKTLCFNWVEELRGKFGIDAVEADFADFGSQLKRLRDDGRHHQCALVMSYDTLRAAKDEWPVINGDEELEEGETLSKKGEILRQIRRWQDHYPAAPFDLVIFDEAALMKNPAAMRSRTGRLLADAAEGALMVTATPLMVHQQDLRTLLRMVDDDFFSNEILFEQLLEDNRPAVKLANSLASLPLDVSGAREQLAQLGRSPFVGESPQLGRIEDVLVEFEASNDPVERTRLRVRAQSLAESLNILASFMTRTRRVQVEELRAIRKPRILTVEMSKEEKQFYWAVVTHVRREAKKDLRAFHVFQVIGLQLRSASCIPALVEELKRGRLETDDAFLEEAFGSAVDEEEEDEEIQLSSGEFRQLLQYDFRGNDTKFSKLSGMLKTLPDSEKVVIFAYYRGTLGYLVNRLEEEGYRCALIHGGVAADDRKKEIYRFRDDPDVRILLSSEVGSEGLNLQFSRVLVNYDLPWNPMKIEQRIGRIDRIGQKADVLTIVHFKSVGTIEERLYERLHQRLELFRNSVGDLEAVLGEEIQRLTVDLITGPLDDQTITNRLEQAGSAAETRLQQIEELESSGESLLAFSDFLQNKIRDDLKNERYVTPTELEFYVRDFFERHMPGTELQDAQPKPGCMTIRLSSPARLSLDAFIGVDPTQRARSVRGERFSITFRREIPESLPPSTRRRVAFLNHLSPLIQWITKQRGEGTEEFVPCAAVTLESTDLPSGIWVCRIERWRFKGLRTAERLAYAAAMLGSEEALTGADAERLIRVAQREGRIWPYPDYPVDTALSYADVLEGLLNELRSSAFDDFCAENQTTLSIRNQRIEAQMQRETQAIERALDTMRERGTADRMIALTKSRLTKTQERFVDKLRSLTVVGAADVTFSEVALVLCRITNPNSPLP